MSGYSGRPVHAKLGLKEGMCVLVLNAPRDYRELVGPDAPEFNLASESSEDLGLVDVKVCAVDETWSALKFVIRKRNRK